MIRYNMRKRPRVSYYELEEPRLDEYVFCTECTDYVFEYCAIHGPLLVVPDDKVPAKPSYPPIVPRSALTVPRTFLHLARSIIPGAGIGVFSTLDLPPDVRFGPYRGLRAAEAASDYCWQIRDGDNRASHMIDAGDANRSNWMRYVNCARHWREQNLVAFQYQGQIYYRTTKIIPRFTELMIFYGSEFAKRLGVDLKRYNSPAGYAYILAAAKLHKSGNSHQNTVSSTSPAEQKNAEDFNNETMASLNNTQNPVIMPDLKFENNLRKVNNTSNIRIIQSPTPTQSLQINVSENFLEAHEPNTSNVNDSTKKVELFETSTKTFCSNIENNFNNMLTCDICPYRTTSEAYLNTHLQAHAGKKSFDCNVCYYKTVNLSTLKRHLRTHTGEKPYSCDVCKKSFNVAGDIKRHLRTHTGEKPYSCDVCKKTFNESGTLKRHLRMHTGDKPYSCDVCKKSFNVAGNLKTHLRTHTGEKPYSCDVCKKSFNVAGHLKTHLRTHTGEKPYSCDFCKKSFNQASNLKIHLKTHK